MNSETVIKAVAIEDDRNGVVRLHHAGKSITLIFHWGVIAGMQKDYGKPQYLRTIAEAIQTRDVLVMSDIISRGSGVAEGREGAMTPIEVMQWSPPLISTVEAVETAWLLASFGPTMAPEDQKNAEEKKLATKKKTRWMQRINQLFGLGSDGINFGVSRPTPVSKSSPVTENASSIKGTQLH